MIAPTDQHTDRVAIRPFRAEDADAVGRLTIASYDAYGRIEGGYRDYLADPLLRADGATALLVADLGGVVVGTVTFVLPTDREWEGPREPAGDGAFRVLAVAPGAEGRGVGRRLVEACLELGRDHGCHRLFITSMSWMLRAHELYRRLGFDRRRDLDVLFPGGPGLAFTRDLTPDAAKRFAPPGPIPATPPWYGDVWIVPES